MIIKDSFGLETIEIRVPPGLARAWRRMHREARRLGCRVDPTDAVKRAIWAGNREIAGRITSYPRMVSIPRRPPAGVVAAVDRFIDAMYRPRKAARRRRAG